MDGERNMKILKAPILFLTWFLLLSSHNSPHAQKVPKAPSRDKAPAEPTLLPLTEAERALGFKSIMANQPDFVADELFSYSEGFGGFSDKSRVARKGDRYFIDTGYVKIITEPGKKTWLNDKGKTFKEESISSEFALRAGDPIDPKILASQKGATFIGLGSQMVGGRRCIKVEVKIPDQAAQVFLYLAEDLKYLVVAIQVLNPPLGGLQMLQNISLNVPSRLVEIPPDYRPLSKHKWLLVDSANISYDGKPGNDFSVFRSDDGNQLFVTLYEPHPDSGAPMPWHYLVYLKEKTVEICFQGMLITAEGKWAWKTKAREAFSDGDYKPNRDRYPCDWRKCPKTIVGTNFAQFPSVYYEDRKSMVRATW
jgi:hypothetical protein